MANEIPAGPELDLAVARTMGWPEVEGVWPNDLKEIIRRGRPCKVLGSTITLWCPSTDANDAMDVVEWLRGMGWVVEMTWHPEGDVVVFLHHAEAGQAPIVRSGPTFPEAVCRAALEVEGRE